MLILIKLYAIGPFIMNKLSKGFISCMLISGLCLHFGLLFLYTSPLTSSHPKIHFITKACVGSFFHQGWSLFVPAPNTRHYLFVRYKNDSNQTVYKDILRDCVENNRQNKFMGNEAIALLFSNSLVYLFHEVPRSAFYPKAPGFTGFKVLNYEVSRYLALHHILKKGQEYELIVHSTGPGGHKTLYVQSLSLNK
jgi:hypothetical protein